MPLSVFSRSAAKHLYGYLSDAPGFINSIEDILAGISYPELYHNRIPSIKVEILYIRSIWSYSAGSAASL